MTDSIVAYGICVRTQEGHHEELPYDLSDWGAQAVETRDSSTMTGVDDANVVLYIAGFESEADRAHAAQCLQTNYPELEILLQEIRDDGWSEGWKKFFAPVVLEKLQVITPWMEPVNVSAQPIVIDPGQAFGTGGHATTKLMLLFIEAHSEKGFPSRILDIGTGSGVLAIGCAKLGATHILGFDVEQASVEATLENAQRNQVSSSVFAQLASPQDMQGEWPLVLANIQLAVFLECAPAIASLVVSGGTLYISGILQEQKEKCLSLWPDFKLLEIRQEGEWLAMALEKK